MIGPTGAILMETLVDPATLAFVDPGAAALVAETSPTSQRIWYRLALSLQPDRIAPRWITIDDATGAVIGTGILGSPSVYVVTGAEDGGPTSARACRPTPPTSSREARALEPRAPGNIRPSGPRW
jgi:hypothetical protein